MSNLRIRSFLMVLLLPLSMDENNNQVSAGQDKINFYLTADYTFSQRLSAQAFFKRDVNIPQVANNFYNSTTYAGVTIRFNLAQ